MRTTQALAPSAAAERARLVVEYGDPRQFKPYARNARTHSAAQVRQIRESIDKFGFNNPLLIRDDGRTIGAGHGRWEAAQLDPPLADVPFIVLHGLTEAQWRAYVIADNKIALNSGWNEELLRIELAELQVEDVDLSDLGFADDELKVLLREQEPMRSGALSERFLAVPFTVLSSRDGWWRDRKKAWLRLGLRSEEGRGEVLKGLSSARAVQGKASESWAGTSVFDPVLCELAYRWFCPPGGQVLDPFAGGSVRGVVACRLGRPYHGIDIRPEQVAANLKQGAAICAGDPHQPVWVVGDSLVALDAPDTPDADFVFSCPPYADLERYSDDAGDLSNMDYAEFLTAYRAIIAKACARLKPDRFACFVVADVRDPAGAYRNFVGDTVEAFRAAGLHLYNEAILVTPTGSLAVRVGRQFAGTRKLGKTHQNILVFVKGDPRKATEACGDVEVGEITADDPDEEPSALAA